MLVVNGVVVTTVLLSWPHDESAAVQAVRPLAVGTTWVYEVFDHEVASGTKTQQILAEAGLSGALLDAPVLSTTYTDYPGLGPTASLTYLGVSPTGLRQHGLVRGAAFQKVVPPAPSFELPLARGQRWSYDGTVGTDGLRFEAEVESRGVVRVAGRVLPDCAHVVTEQEWTSSSSGASTTETIEEWWCPGVGVVRTVDSIPDLDVAVREELASFQGPDDGWTARPQTPHAVPAGGVDPPGTHAGFTPARTNARADGHVSPRLAWTDNRPTSQDFPPVGDGTVMIVAEHDGEVAATDLDSGQVRWRLRFPGPIVAQPTIVGDLVLVADAARNLWALDLRDGTARWGHRFGDVVSAAPGSTGTDAVVVVDDGTVQALDLDDGTTTWTARLGRRAPNPPAITGDAVVVADTLGSVLALDPGTGAELWSAELDGSLVSGPTLAGDCAVLADDGGVLYCLRPDDGGIGWERRTNHFPGFQLAATDEVVVAVGDHAHLDAYDLADGSHRWHTDLDETRTGPAIVGDQVVTVSEAGHLRVVDLADGGRAQDWRLPRPGSSTSLTADIPLGLVGDVLVVCATTSSAAYGNVLWAYPLTEGSAHDGVSFRATVRAVPARLVGPAELDETTLLVPASDGALYRVPPAGAPDVLAGPADGELPGVVVQGDVVLTQVGSEVLAFRGDGATPRWRVTGAEPVHAAVPAASGDTVYVPLATSGLLAVDRETGEELWRHPLTDAFGVGAPLVLPGGDVALAVGSLARYDARTGEQRWELPGSVAFSSLAYDDGVVYADLVSDTDAALTAVDADSGRVLWSRPNPATNLFLGPAAHDGVVVLASSTGAVTAYDGHSGASLWRFQMSTAPAGPPLILDGRVYLSESGRTEDLYSREYRISAHDLRTGAFAGAYQPPSTGYPVHAAVGLSQGTLLLPATTGLGASVVLLEPR